MRWPWILLSIIQIVVKAPFVHHNYSWDVRGNTWNACMEWYTFCVLIFKVCNWIRRRIFFNSVVLRSLFTAGSHYLIWFVLTILTDTTDLVFTYIDWKCWLFGYIFFLTKLKLDILVLYFELVRRKIAAN